MVGDTTPEAAALVLRAIRQQSPAQRVEAALALSESVRAISLTTFRARFPERSILELVELITGESMLATARSGPVMYSTSCTSSDGWRLWEWAKRGNRCVITPASDR